MSHPRILIAAIAFVLLLEGGAWAADVGHVQVKCEPGVQIFLDGTLEGVTNREVGGLILQDVPVGAHTIKALKPGYEAQETKFQLVRNQVFVYQVKRLVPKVKIVEEGEPEGGRFEAQVGRIIITSLPVDCVITIHSAGVNNYRKTKEKITLSDVPVGKHPAVFHALNKSLRHVVEVKPLATIELMVNFLKGEVTVLGGDLANELPEGGIPEDAPTIGIGGGGAFGLRSDHRSKPGLATSWGRAVERALRWLAAHQSPDGSWQAAGFGQWCDGKQIRDPRKRPDGPGSERYDIGVTGLALCAFLSAGYTPRGKHPYAKTVNRGLRYLKYKQDPEGCFGKRDTMQYCYRHAVASLAMVEAYGMTGSPALLRSAQRALDFIKLMRNPFFAWRYGVKPGDNDTSISGWMTMVLHSAVMINRHAVANGLPAPLNVEMEAFDGARAWLQKTTDPDYGRVGYVMRGTGPARPQEVIDQFPGEKSESMTAVGMVMRVAFGEDPRKSKIIRLGAELCAKLPPTWNPADGSIDMYYWYYATMAMYQVGGRYWDIWKRAMEKGILHTQRRDTDPCGYLGSWDPIGPWGVTDGGRVYSTALMAMCLAVRHRYPRHFGK